jgi:hypothetical protein
MTQRKLFVPGSQRRLGADVPVAELWRFGCAYENQIAIVRVMHLGRLWVDHNGDCLRDDLSPIHHLQSLVRDHSTLPVLRETGSTATRPSPRNSQDLWIGVPRPCFRPPCY